MVSVQYIFPLQIAIFEYLTTLTYVQNFYLLFLQRKNKHNWSALRTPHYPETWFIRRLAMLKLAMHPLRTNNVQLQRWLAIFKSAKNWIRTSTTSKRMFSYISNNVLAKTTHLKANRPYPTFYAFPFLLFFSLSPYPKKKKKKERRGRQLLRREYEKKSQYLFGSAAATVPHERPHKRCMGPYGVG